MGNLAMTGIPTELQERFEYDYSNYPPWVTLWIPFFIDLVCTPFECRSSWRSYLPESLGGPGGWFSEEFEIVSASQMFKDALTFEEFQTQQGFQVTKGSGLLAGLQGGTNLNAWFKSLYRYMFETPTTALSNLLSPTGLGVVVLLVLVIKLIKKVTMPRFQNIGRRLARKAHGDAWLEENEIRITKFGEYVFRLCYHSFISLVGFYFFWDAPWWNKDQGGTVNLYTDFPRDPIKPSMAWYYLFQAAYNVDAMVSLLEISLQVKVFPKDSVLPLTIGWSDTVRGDFNEMMAHHIVTNALVFLSSYFRQTRIGSMVFWMHDISDVPVDLCKLANFVKWHKATAWSFFLLCSVWFVTRLYVLPFTIWASVYTESTHLAVGNPMHFHVYFYAYQPLFLMLLGALIGLHVVWFSMFIQMGRILIFKGEAHDISEHKGGEEGAAPKKKHTNGVVVNGSKKKIT